MKQIVSVGIDVSKGKSTVCAMIHPNTIIKESFEVLHTVEEMSMLLITSDHLMEKFVL